MTKPIWEWSIGRSLLAFARGMVRYLVFLLPTAVWVLLDLFFHGLHPAYVRIWNFHHACWPAWFDPVDP